MSAIEGELIHNHYLSPSTESYNGTKKSTDFIGFTFGGKHSTELGINRVSNGSRYTETLLPEFSNKTVNVPGANRVDYLGMEFTQKNFPLDIAFDSVTEEQLREMKRLFNTEKPLPLVFDESPYKTYYAKAGGNPSFTYVCFDEDGKRIYKGEGKIDLISFYPYAFCDPNYVTNLKSDEIPDNLHEWLIASGLSETKLESNKVYNPGDFDTPFWIKIPSSTLPAGAVTLDNNSLVWSASGVVDDDLPEDIYIIIDGRNQLIEGYSADGVKSGRIYNKFITDGNWFNIPKGQGISEMGLPKGWELNYKILYI